MKALFITLTMVFYCLPQSYSHFNKILPGAFFQATETQLKSAENPLWSLLRKDKPNPETEAGNYQIRTIVIDPGHGGHDAGCSGGHKHEKEIVLAIAKRLGNAIQNEFPYIKVVFTRDSDVFIPLYRRARIANQHKADLFISIHCNSIENADYVKGSETYVLGLHRAADNLEVAKRENASILLEDNYQNNYMGYDPNSAENHILMSMFQNAFLEQSINFAEKVEFQIKYGAHGKSRGVKQAGFLVLRETAMPSVLIESGYLSNTIDDNYLSGTHGQQQIAMAIFRAFKSYKTEVESAPGANNSPAIQQQIVYAQERQRISTPSTPAAPSQQVFTKSPDYQSLIIPSSSTPRVNTDHTPALPQFEPMVYKIQLASGTDLINTTKTPWSRISESVEIIQEGKLYKYLSPGFSNMKEAISYRNKVRKLGFKDAFVVAFRGTQRVK